jgi:eukaryotic-like serine/threonine-protein kinase
VYRKAAGAGHNQRAVNQSDVETGAADSAPTPEALDRWGPFEQLQRVGKGSFGEVYRAFDPTLQRHVALKLLIPRGRDSGDEASDLLREARAIARVRHPNVVPIYGVDRHAGRVGFWSDFVRGQTLSALIGVQGPLGPREAALVGIDVCRAVGAVHAAGLLHRDIKAANVMREEGGRILLMDFGLTHERGTDAFSSGTPIYMAPELLLGEPASASSDVYAIGILLFYLLTAQYPIDSMEVGQLRAAHAAGTRRNLLDVRPDLPEALARVIGTATHPAADRRFASTGSMIAALSEAIGLGSGATAETPRDQPRRFRAWMLASAAALVALVALGLLFVQSKAGTAPPAAPGPAVAGAQDDYRRAHDLLAHYYRPQALETAIPLLEKIVAQDAQFAPAFADLGRANFLQFTQQRDTKFIAPARESSLRALALAPDLASAHVTLGALYTLTGQNDLAAVELDEALRIDRFNGPAHAALAELLNRQGRSSLVEPRLQQAVTLAPDDWSLTAQLGAYYLDKGEWAQAEAQYRHAVDQVPDNPRAYNNLGLAYRGLDRLDEAATAFRKAIDLEPTFLRFRNLGMVLAEAGKYPEAAVALEKSIALRPTQYRAWGLLASVHRAQHVDENKVRDTYLKAIALAADLLRETPKDEYLLADVGTYYAALGQEKESLPRLAQAAALAPDVPEVLYQVAIGYEMLHHREDALRWLVKARAGGYPAAAIARNPQLAALRTDPRYGAAADGTR